MKTKIFTIFILSLTLLTLSGCTARLTEPEMSFEPPKYVEQMPAFEDERNYVSTGSIFGQGDNPLFSDHKAMHVSDIVTVVISETASSSNTGSKNLAQSDTSALGGGIFSTAGGANGAVDGVAGPATAQGYHGAFPVSGQRVAAGRGIPRREQLSLRVSKGYQAPAERAEVCRYQ